MPTQLETNIGLIETGIQNLINTTNAIINHTEPTPPEPEV